MSFYLFKEPAKLSNLTPKTASFVFIEGHLPKKIHAPLLLNPSQVQQSSFLFLGYAEHAFSPLFIASSRMHISLIQASKMSQNGSHQQRVLFQPFFITFSRSQDVPSLRRSIVLPSAMKLTQVTLFSFLLGSVAARIKTPKCNKNNLYRCFHSSSQLAIPFCSAAIPTFAVPTATRTITVVT